MLRVARDRPGAGSGRIRWHHASAEEFDFRGPYDLITAADSLHWMDLDVVLPKVAGALRPDAYLAIVGRSRSLPGALEDALVELIPKYSTNQDYESYDVVDLVSETGCFTEAGRRQFVAPCRQSLEGFIQSIHSRNGFSRDRMDPAAATAFDSAVRDAATNVAEGGTLHFEVVGTVVWGHPTGIGV